MQGGRNTVLLLVQQILILGQDQKIMVLNKKFEETLMANSVWTGFYILGRQDPEGFQKTFGEISGAIEACLKSNFRNIEVLFI